MGSPRRHRGGLNGRKGRYVADVPPRIRDQKGLYVVEEPNDIREVDPAVAAVVERGDGLVRPVMS
jgi:hypothetical protein